MERRCYGCNKELTAFEAMKGQAVFNWIELHALEEQNKDFEGWVHCRGEKSQFTDESDTELKELCDQMGIDFYDQTCHACNKCARELALTDNGIVVPRSVIKGEDYIYRCPECSSTHVTIYHSTSTGFTYAEGKKVKETTVDVDSAYLVECDSCHHKINISNDHSSDDFHDYETEIV